MHLKNKVPDRCIERGGPASWPQCSQDLTLCDFFLWGHIKFKIYDTPIASMEELKTRTRDETNEVSPENLNKVLHNMKYS